MLLTSVLSGIRLLAAEAGVGALLVGLEGLFVLLISPLN